MLEFLYTAHPARVVFGAGRIAELRTELDRLDIKRALVLSTPEQSDMAAAVQANVGDACAGLFTGATMHTPVGVTERALATVRDLEADGLVAIGGGSTIGLAKALALRTDLPQIAIPTTYAGSEMTPILGETRDGNKVTQSSPGVLPETVIYDVDLTIGLPPSISATSGINAVAHAVEALYAQERNPVTNLMALEAVRAFAQALPAIAQDPTDRAARSLAQYAAWLCGTCLGAVGMSLHHKLCHILGGSFDLPHAETHTIVLPHALAYNASHAREAITALAGVLNKPDPALAIYDLVGRLGSARALRDLGMPESGIDFVVEQAFAKAYWNPRPLEREALRRCVARAWAGERPASD